MHLKLGIILVYPFAVLKNKNPSGSVEIQGNAISLTEFLFQGLGITYDFWIPYSTYSEPSPWTHMITRLQNDNIHLFVGPTVSSEYNYARGLNLHPHSYSSYSILASSGLRREGSLLNFFYKIDIQAWYLVILAMLLLVVISAISEVYHHNGSILAKEIFHQFWNYLGALFCEGSPRPSHSRRAQAIFMVWLLSVLVLSNALFSQFQAAITVQENDDYIYTVQGVVDRPHIIPLVASTSPFGRFLSNSDSKTYEALLQRIDENPQETRINMSGLTSAFPYQKIKDGKAVLFLTKEFVQAVLSQFCMSLTGERKLYFLDEDLYPHFHVIMASRNLPECILKKLNVRLRALIEGDISSRWLSYSQRNYWKCEMETESDLPNIALTQLKSTFYMIWILQLVSFCVLLLELLFSKIMSSH